MESVPAQNSIDLNFIDELIPHQETSLGLTRLALRSPLSPALLPIANSLLRSHSLTLRRLREIRLTLR